MFHATKSLATISILAVGASGATAFAADSPHVAPQPALTAGQASPIRIPGTKGTSPTEPIDASTPWSSRISLRPERREDHQVKPRAQACEWPQR